MGVAETLNQIGVIHWKQSNHIEGTKQLLKALKIEEETGDKFGNGKFHITSLETLIQTLAIMMKP